MAILKACAFFAVLGLLVRPSAAANVLPPLPEARAPFVREKGIPAQHDVDFWGKDAIHVPVAPTRNLMVNGSFEQRFKGWRWQYGGTHWADVPKGCEKHGIVEGGLFGRMALIIRDGQPNASPLWSTSVPVQKGARYTLSWYGKAPKRHQVRVVVCSAMPGGEGSGDFDWGWGRSNSWTAVGTEWERHEATFTAPASGLFVQIWGTGGNVLIDGIQLEEGEKATDYIEAPATGFLTTSDPDNHVYAHKRIGAKLELSGSNGWRGEVRVRVRNFYSEELYDRTFPVALPCEVVDLGFDDADFGLGVFCVRLDFKAASQTPCGPSLPSWTDYQRFAVLNPLDNRHPTATFYCVTPWFERVERGRDVAMKMRDWGLGMADGIDRGYSRGGASKLFRESGMKGTLHPLTYDLGFIQPTWMSTNIAPERLQWIETNAYRFASICREDDTLWTFGNEEDWFVRREGFEAHWKCIEACYRGCRRAFDERGLKLRFAPTHGCSHYFRGRNRDLIDGYLETANRHGFKYDAVAIHAYSNIDGGVLGPHDADAEVQYLIERMGYYGYPDSTPVLISEAFNMLPYRIPEWGAWEWSDGVICGPPSQDIGNREFLQAGSMARMYLIYLKYWPKVALCHNWQFRPGFLDANLSPHLWLKMVNTLGHLLPDPRFYGDARPFSDVRGYVYMQGGRGILAVWTTNHEVERGKRRGAILKMALPKDAAFLDLMGNARVATHTAGEKTDVPLTPAPLFILSKDAEGLLKAIRTAGTDDPATGIRCDIRPAANGSVGIVLENATSRPQPTPFGEIPAGTTISNLLRQADSRGFGVMEMRHFTTNYPFLSSPWKMDYFKIPRCGTKPDWRAIPAMKVTNMARHNGRDVTAKAEMKMAWNDDYLFLRMEVEDPAYIPKEMYPALGPNELWRYDGCLEVYLDAFGDARATHGGSDLDDSRYDFAVGRVNRQIAVNWQLAQGTQSATDEEIRKKVIRYFKCTEKGYVHGFALAKRYLAPIELKRGTTFGFGLFLQIREDVKQTDQSGLSLSCERGWSCNGCPKTWPMAILD